MLESITKLSGQLIDQIWHGSPTAQTRAGRESFHYKAFQPEKLSKRQFRPQALILADLDSTTNEIKSLNADLTGVGKLMNLSMPLLHTESIASSQIEGVNVDFEQLMLAGYQSSVSGPGRSALANVSAMMKAIEIGGKSGPLTAEDLCSLHDILMEQDIYMKEQNRGKFRREPVWVGRSSLSPRGAEYVAPPHEHVPALIDDLLAYINSGESHPLVKAAVAHAQFESIHPFVDGNGRVGRCLIHVTLKRSHLAATYIPPISLLFSKSKDVYIEGLTNYRLDSATEWLLYFATIARGSVRQARELIARSEVLAKEWSEHPDLPRHRSGTALEAVINNLVALPVFDVKAMATATGKRPLAVRNAVTHLEQAGIVVAAFPGRRRNRIWQAPDVFALVSEIADEATELASEA